MPNLITKDNSRKELQDVCKENFSNIYDTLTVAANVQLKDIVSENLLIFPKKLGENEDEIDELSIIELSGSRENAREAKIKTGNLMGFVGIRPKGQNNEAKNVYLTIRSRFSKKNENDFFMQYILQKVFSINLVDFKFTTGQDHIFNLMMFLFPYMLKKAMRQGIYRTYQTFRRNDANIKGTIDISRHIRMNIPFAGNVAYSSRERTADNPVIQLIRHTIEEIKAGTFGKNILNCDEDMRRNVSMIVEATPSYNRMAREKVIRQNIKPFSHPYYTDYGPLRKLCLAILRHKKISFSQSDKDEVYGILFDGAWLWEEYLDTVLNKCGFTHAKNKIGENGIMIYAGGKSRFPDFYKGNQCGINTEWPCNNSENCKLKCSGNIILDAKYKYYDNNPKREDLFQVISYMHIFPAQEGGLIYPLDNGQSIIQEQKRLYGYGGQIFTIGVPISKADKFPEFCDEMQQMEKDLAALADKGFSE
jgi:5-methylcytosine-specific restriction endonuclease McrBC regulatory subunit McrC